LTGFDWLDDIKIPHQQSAGFFLAEKTMRECQIKSTKKRYVKPDLVEIETAASASKMTRASEYTSNGRDFGNS